MEPDTIMNGHHGRGGARASRAAWLGLAVLALPTLALATDLSVLFLALPQLTADLDATNSQMLWILDIYGFMIAGFLIIMGTLGDRIGRRRLLLAGAAAFGIASVVAAFSPTPATLIAARAVLGVAGATLMPSALGLIGNMFTEPEQRGMAIAIWMSCFMAGVALGPVVGGLLLQWFWWGSVFMANAVPIAGLLVAGPLLLPESRDPHAGRLDLASTALALATILPIVYAFKEWAHAGPRAAVAVAAGAGLACGGVFVRRQLRLSSPLLDLGLFRSRRFSAALGVMLVGSATVAGLSLFLTQHLQLGLGLSPLATALWGVPPALCIIVGSMVAPIIVRRVGPAVAIGGFLMLGAVGLLVLTQVGLGWGLGTLMAAFVVAFLGVGPIGAICTELAVGAAPPEKASSASSVSETSGELGIALGVALLGTVGTFVYRMQVRDAIPAEVPTRAALAAQDTLAGAVAAAEALPTELATALLEPAGRAFLQGLNAVAAVQALVVLATAGLAVVLLRRVQPMAAPGAVAESIPSPHDRQRAAVLLAERGWQEAFDGLDEHLRRIRGDTVPTAS